MTQEDIQKKLKKSLELKRDMMKESKEILKNIQQEFLTTSRIACLQR